MFNYFHSETLTSLLLQLCLFIINVIIIMTIVVISGLITMINLNISRPYIKINIIVISMRNSNCVSRNCTIVDVYDTISRCTHLVFTYMMNTSKYDHFTLVVLTWSICCSSPVSCVCDVYPGLYPSASCLCVVASATTLLVVITPIPGQSLFPFSMCMGRVLSRLSVGTYLINNYRTFIIVSSQNRWLSIR